MILRRLPALFAGLWAVLGCLEARSFLIDFGPNNGIDGNVTPSGAPTYGPGNGSTGVPDANGRYWNNVIGTGTSGGSSVMSYAGLVDASNAASSVSVTLGSGWLSAGKQNGGLIAPKPARLGSFAIASATQDFFYVDNAATLQVSGLDPGRLYNLRLFGSRNVNAVRRTTYTVNAGNGQFSTTLQTSGPGLGNGTGGEDGTEVYDGNNRTIATISGIQTDSTGQFLLRVSIAEGTYGYLGILEIGEGEIAAPLVTKKLRVDFGCDDGTNGNPTINPDSQGNYWNNFKGGSDIPAGASLLNLVTTENVPTEMDITLTTPWRASGRHNGGLLAPLSSRLGEFAVPSATEDYFFTDGANGTNKFLRLSGLNPQKLYTLRMFGSRDETQVRRTTYTVTAANGTISETLQTSGLGLGNGTGGADGTQTYNGNVRNIAAISGAQPDANGQLSLGVTAAEGGIGYLGILEIIESSPSVSAAQPGARTNIIDRWAAQDALDPVAPGGVLFVGSSSIRRWEPLTEDLSNYRIVQRGFGGSQFSELIPNINRLVIPYQPSAIVVFEGSNDLRNPGKTGESVLADFQTFVKQVRAQLPEVPICFISITCCPSYFWSPNLDPQRRSANSLIKNYCNSDPNSKLFFFDTTALFDHLHDTNPGAWMKYFVDDTHLNRAGYAHWISVVRPGLQTVLAPNKSFTPNPSTLAPGDKLLFDFGPGDGNTGDPTIGLDVNGSRWNNWHATVGNGVINAGEHIGALVNSAGSDTGIRMTITGGFACSGKAPGGGLASPQAAFLGDLAVGTGTNDYFYSTANDINDGTNDDVPGGFMLEGLNPGMSYEFRFFGSRNDTATGITEYAVSGANKQQANLVTCGEEVGRTGGNANDSKIAILRGVKPDAFGQVFVDVTLLYGSAAHLNAMEIVATSGAAPLNYLAWRSRNFSPTELGDPALEANVWGNDADPDADGCSNLLEYAAAKDPRAYDNDVQTFNLESLGESGRLTFTYRKNLAATDLHFQVECSDNLTEWSSVADELVSSADGIEIRKASVARAGFPQRWLRLKVELASGN